MSKITIVANLHANPNHIDDVKAELMALIPPTLDDEGCINYDLHQNNDDPARFVFYENWESRDLWQTHMNTAHLARYVAATEGKVDKFTLHEMTPVVKEARS